MATETVWYCKECAEALRAPGPVQCKECKQPMTDIGWMEYMTPNQEEE